MMDLKIQSENVVDKFETVYEWLTQRYLQRRSTYTTNPLSAEIQQLLEETLAEALIQPPLRGRNFVTLEPLTEQQKVMDLAG